MNVRSWSAVLLLPSLPLGAQEAQSPYVGQEARAIKALSPEEARDLLEGRGMGLAKAAELNRYPGPKHVLELADALELTPVQRGATQAAFERMAAAAKRLGASIVEKEGDLDRRFGAGTMDAATLEAATAEIARLQDELRAVHLRAHLELRPVLSDEQVARYVHLRGYDSGAPHQHRPSH